MPTYVYKFIETGETIEVQQSFDDDTLTEAVHPASGDTMPVKKVFLPVGVTFKGDGFYKTDSRASSKSSASIKGESGASSGKSDGSSGKSDGSSGKSDGSSGKSTSGDSSGSSSTSSSSSDSSRPSSGSTASSD
jgi:predicted nucleic acid-binding Zn ribbon protein